MQSHIPDQESLAFRIGKSIIIEIVKVICCPKAQTLIVSEVIIDIMALP